jgi:broad specificity phosphatase PhoE
MSRSYRGHNSSTSIYLARHGKTALNAAGVLRGHLDPPLDVTGLHEAEALATMLGVFKPSLIFSSPLRRALETAWCIANECGVDVQVENQLIDRDYGKWSGWRADEICIKWGSLDNAPGVEPRDLVLSRARNALEAIADRTEDGAVVVAHDAINRLLISSFDPIHFADVDAIPQRTGCFNLLQRRTSAWRVARVDVCPTNADTGFAVTQ